MRAQRHKLSRERRRGRNRERQREREKKREDESEGAEGKLKRVDVRAIKRSSQHTCECSETSRVGKGERVEVSSDNESEGLRGNGDRTAMNLESSKNQTKKGGPKEKKRGREGECTTAQEGQRAGVRFIDPSIQRSCFGFNLLPCNNSPAFILSTLSSAFQFHVL